MNLPDGTICGDCVYFPWCSNEIGRIEKDEVCNWEPIRFERKVK